MERVCGVMGKGEGGWGASTVHCLTCGSLCDVRRRKAIGARSVKGKEARIHDVITLTYT